MMRRVRVSCGDSFSHTLERRHLCLRFAGIMPALSHPLTRMVLTSCLGRRLPLKLADHFFMFRRRKLVSFVGHDRRD